MILILNYIFLIVQRELKILTCICHHVSPLRRFVFYCIILSRYGLILVSHAQFSATSVNVVCGSRQMAGLLACRIKSFLAILEYET